MMCRSLCTVSLLALLAACGGSGGSPVDPDPVIPGDDFEDVVEDSDVEAPPDSGSADNPAEEFSDRFGDEDPDEGDGTDGAELGDTLEGSEEATIPLTGIVFIRNTAPNRSVVELRDGTFTESDGSRALDGQIIELTGDIPGTFTQAASFLQNGEDAVGIIGIATDPTAMQTTGSATFTGGATGLVIIGDGGFELRDGQSTVAVDFASGALRAELDNFTSVSNVSGNLANAPFDGIILEGAVIDGTSFSGGTISTSGGQSVAEVVGGNADQLSLGQFYGTNADGTAPTEVGGIVYTEGDDGLIFGSFIAAE